MVFTKNENYDMDKVNSQVLKVITEDNNERAIVNKVIAREMIDEYFYDLGADKKKLFNSLERMVVDLNADEELTAKYADVIKQKYFWLFD